MTEKKKPTLYLIDGSNYVYRAFFAIQGLTNSRGVPTNAVFGFNNMLAKLLRDRKPEHIAVVFDAKGPTFRNEAFEDYKAHRKPMPDELKPQFGMIKNLVRAYRIPVLEIGGIEADDVIGTLARRFEGEGVNVVIVSGDKDLMQLVSDGVVMIDTMKDKTYDAAGVEERFGVGPDRVAELLGLMGDTSDNIPGVPGVGPKTALQLIKEYGTVEGVLQNVGKIRNERIRKAVTEHADQARLSRELAVVKTDADVELALESARYEGPDREALKAIFKEMEFSSLIQDLEVRDRASGGRNELVTTAEALHGLIRRIEKAGECALHLELTSELPMYAELAGMALSLEPGEAFYIPLKTGKGPEGGAPWRDHALKELSPVLSQREDPQTRPRPEEHSHRPCPAGDPPSGDGLRHHGGLLPSQPLEEEPRHHRGGPGIPGPRADPGERDRGQRRKSPVACRRGSRAHEGICGPACRGVPQALSHPHGKDPGAGSERSLRTGGDAARGGAGRHGAEGRPHRSRAPPGDVGTIRSTPCPVGGEDLPTCGGALQHQLAQAAPGHPLRQAQAREGTQDEGGIFHRRGGPHRRLPRGTNFPRRSSPTGASRS